MKTFTFKVVVEPNSGIYRASCPPLIQLGAFADGFTRSEALQKIQEIVSVIVQQLRDDGIEFPEHTDVEVYDGALVAVTV